MLKRFRAFLLGTLSQRALSLDFLQPALRKSVRIERRMTAGDGGTVDGPAHAQ